MGVGIRRGGGEKCVKTGCWVKGVGPAGLRCSVFGLWSLVFGLWLLGDNARGIEKSMSREIKDPSPKSKDQIQTTLMELDTVKPQPKLIIERHNIRFPICELSTLPQQHRQPSSRQF